MSAERENAELLRTLWDDVSRRGPAAMRDYFSPNYVRHSSERDYTREEFIQIMIERHEAFPDLVSRTVDVVAQEDRVAYRWESTGTHEGLYQRIPPTHRQVKAQGITISRIIDGQIVEDWASWNKNSVLHSLGILPIATD